MNKISKLFK